MAKVQPFHLTASIEFLRSQIFEWIKERHRGHGSAGCVDYVLRVLESSAAEHRMIFPVSELQVQSTLTLGSVTVSTFPESIFEKIEPKLIDGQSAAEQAERYLSMRRDFQGFAVAACRPCATLPGCCAATNATSSTTSACPSITARSKA